MSPTSISGGGKLLTGGELISPASCDAELVPVGKHQEEDLSSTNLEQRCYKLIGMNYDIRQEVSDVSDCKWQAYPAG